MAQEMQKPVLIIGAGPAGLTAAYELCKRGIRSVIIEKDAIVGGIARTEAYKGYRFDIGGHRFFTKVSRVMDFWKEILDAELLTRPRLSHIYYKQKFFSYPIKPFDALKKLGLWQSFLCMVSYAKAKLFPRKQVVTFEDYIVNNFGWKLYNTFFKSYTEKVWGIPCTQISAQWAAQRIKGLSLVSTLKAAVFGNRDNKIKSLIQEFYYPRLGPGMMWEKTLERCLATGLCEIRFNTTLDGLQHDGTVVQSATIADQNGKSTVACSHVISTMPIGELLHILHADTADEPAHAHARQLSYRDFILVALIIDKDNLFPDNWIYVHDPDVEVGRIQNFKNWSPDMVPDPNKTCLGLEYFTFTTEALWNKSDADLIAQASEELAHIGLARKEDIHDGTVIRMEKTYPIYDPGYEEAIPHVREAVGKFTNVHPVGRNGMHRYNNQDHSMLTAMLAVENICGANHDIWSVNTEMVYHEEKAGE